MSSSSGAHTRALGGLEVVAGIILEFVPGGQTIGTDLILLGSSTILETLLTPNPQSSGSQGIVRSSVANQQIIYGQVLAGGVLQFSSSWGTNGASSGQNTAFLTCAISHSLTRKNSAGTAGMPIGGIAGFYLNDVFIPVNAGGGAGGWNLGRGLSNNGSGTCGISTGTIAGKPAPYNPLSQNLWISWSDGSQTTADACLTTNFTTIPAGFVGHGIAYSVFTLFASSDQGTYSAAFPAGLETPGTIKALINGQRLYDPRLDSTNGGTGTQRLSDTTTWTFSSNPALVVADYLTRAKTDGGGGYSTNQISWPSVAAAANVCDTDVTVPAYGATWSGSAWSATNTVAQYTFNGTLDTSTDVNQNVNTILKSMAGWLTVNGGVINIFAGSPTVASGTIDETFLAGDVALTCQIQRAQMWNAVRFTYGAEPNADYNPGQGMPLTNSTYEAQDGGVRLWNNDTIPGCNNQFNAQILERIKLNQSRNKMTLQMKCNLKALQFQAGDVVNVSITELALSNAPFRVIQLAMSSDYSITLSLLQENAGTFALPPTPDAVYQAFNVASFQALYRQLPAAPATPSSVAAYGLSGGNLITWVPPAANTYAYELVYRSLLPTSGFSQIATVTGDSFNDTNVTAGTTYYYYVVAVQPFNMANQESGNSATVSCVAQASPTSASLPNVIGSTANFNVTSAGWYEVALSDNSQYADYRCGFTSTVTVKTGASQGTCDFLVTSDSTGTNIGLTQLQGASNVPVTQVRVRTDGSNHIALDVYIAWVSGTISVSVAVAPVTGAGNGASAQAGLAATAGTVVQTLPLDLLGGGGNGGGFVHIGPGGKWHGLLDSGDVYHGGAHVFDPTQRFMPGLDYVLDTPSGTYQRMPTANMDVNRRGLIDATQAGHIGAWNLDTRVVEAATPTYRRVGSGYSDPSGRVVTVWDDVTGVPRSGGYVGEGARRSQAAIDSGNNVLNVYGKAASVIKSQSDTWLDPRLTNALLVGNSTYGWFDVIQNAGVTGRGSYEVELSNSGSITPFRLRLAVHVDWAYNATIQLLAATAVDITALITQCIIAKETATGYTHLLVYVPSGATNWTLHIRAVANPDSGSILTSPFTNLGTGTGTPAGYTLFSTLDMTKLPTLATSIGTVQVVHSNLLGNLGTPGSGLHTGDGSNLHATVQAGQNYMLTGCGLTDTGTTSKTVSMAAGTVYYGTTGSLSLGASSVSGLSPSTKYYCYVDLPSWTGGTYQLVCTTDGTQISRSPMRVFIGWIMTQASGGGGGGGGPGCLHPSVHVLTRSGVLPAGALRLGDELLTPDGRWTPIIALTREPCSEWLDVETEAGIARVTLTQPYRMADSGWMPAKMLRVGDALAHGLSVLAVTPVAEQSEKIILTIARPHAFMLTGRGPEIHNGTVKP